MVFAYGNIDGDETLANSRNPWADKERCAYTRILRQAGNVPIDSSWSLCEGDSRFTERIFASSHAHFQELKAGSPDLVRYLGHTHQRQCEQQRD